MVTLADVLHSASGSTVLACQILQASALVTRHGRVQTATISANHIQLQVVLIDTCDVFVLEACLEDHVVLRTEVTFAIELSLKEVQDVLGLSPDGLCDREEVLPRGLGRGNVARDWVLSLLALAFLHGVLVLLVGNLLNAVEQE